MHKDACEQEVKQVPGIWQIGFNHDYNVTFSNTAIHYISIVIKNYLLILASCLQTWASRYCAPTIAAKTH